MVKTKRIWLRLVNGNSSRYSGHRQPLDLLILAAAKLRLLVHGGSDLYSDGDLGGSFLVSLALDMALLQLEVSDVTD